MNRIIIFIFLGFLLTSCGSRRKVKDLPKPSKVVVVKPSKNTPNFNNALEYIAYFKQTAINEMQLSNVTIGRVPVFTTMMIKIKNVLENTRIRINLLEIIRNF